MSKSMIVGLIVGFGCILAGFKLEGGAFSALLKPTAAFIVFGGTIGAVVVSTTADDLKRLPKIFKVAFREYNPNFGELIEYFKEISIKTRKEGLLSLESSISGSENLDPFIKKGLQLIVDGTDPHAVRDILETEAHLVSERHRIGAGIFDDAGGYAPTMGIVGTVCGLVNILGNLGENSADLGPEIAVAFIATLYGIGSANLMWLPIGKKLKAMNKIEAKEKELIIEAIISIQEGTNPNTLVEKLKGFLNQDQAAKVNTNEGKAVAQ
jgi:chemotaxis protein MotA